MDAGLRARRPRKRRVDMDARQASLAGPEPDFAPVAARDRNRIAQVDDQHAFGVR